MRIIIIVAIIVGVVTAGTVGYLLYKQDMCMQMPGYMHNPRQNNLWDCLQYNEDNKPETLYKIPVHSYEIWNSNGIVIHGMVDKPGGDLPVTIKIEDGQGNLIETSQVIPDDSGRFVHGIMKLDSEIWENISTYTVTAVYPNPNSEDNNSLDQIFLDKDKVPLNRERISQLTHDQIIQVIKDWNDVGGSMPFTIISPIGIEDTYSLGDAMPFYIQKTGYGNPCHDSGALIFDNDRQVRIATGFYLEVCNHEQETMESFNYIIPYNQDIFPKLAPIMNPGNYTLVVGAGNIDVKYKKDFLVLPSDFTHDYVISYKLQKDSTDNIQTMTINLNSGSINITNPDGSKRQSSVDTDTLVRINAEIIENSLVENAMTNHKLGENCDTCSFGEVKIAIEDVDVHMLIFDETSFSVDSHSSTILSGESKYLFSLVDCVAYENNFDTFWITDKPRTKDYEKCSEIGEAISKPTPKYGKTDYDFWINDKQKPGIPPNASRLGAVHEHASILVSIFGDNLDFSKNMFQIKNSYIHFEGRDGTTIHKHAENVTLGFLFETLNMELTDDCLTLPDGRYFCNEEADGFSLKLFVNGERVESLSEYVLSNKDRILISYGFEDDDQVDSQLDELDSQRIIS